MSDLPMIAERLTAGADVPTAISLYTIWMVPTEDASKIIQWKKSMSTRQSNGGQSLPYDASAHYKYDLSDRDVADFQMARSLLLVITATAVALDKLDVI